MNSRRFKGFTLVELMVVVAIIGVLSSVAIPSFKKYQAKSRSSEAKLKLSAMHTAEMSFFQEYGIFVSCLGNLNFQMPGGANYYYTMLVDWSGSNAKATAAGFNCPAGPINAGYDPTDAVDGIHFFPATNTVPGCLLPQKASVPFSNTSAIALGGPGLTVAEMVLSVAGNVSTLRCDGAQDLLGTDVWIMRYNWGGIDKELVHYRSGY